MTTAKMAPSWMTMSKDFDPSPSEPRKWPTRMRWPVDEIGRYSVSPSTKPSNAAMRWLTRSPKDAYLPRYPPTAEDVKFGERECRYRTSGALNVFRLPSRRQRGWRGRIHARFAQVGYGFDEATHAIASNGKPRPKSSSL